MVLPPTDQRHARALPARVPSTKTLAYEEIPLGRYSFRSLLLLSRTGAPRDQDVSSNSTIFSTFVLCRPTCFRKFPHLFRCLFIPDSVVLREELCCFLKQFIRDPFISVECFIHRLLHVRSDDSPPWPSCDGPDLWLENECDRFTRRFHGEDIE